MYKKQHVLIVRNAYSFDFGGGERYPINLAIELKENKLEPVVATAHKQILELGKSQNIHCIKMPWLSNQQFSGHRALLLPFYVLWQAYLFFWYLYAVVRYGIDVVHIQSRDDFIAGTLAARLLHRRVIWTDHADLKYIFQNVGVLHKNIIGKFVYACSKLSHSIVIVSKNELRLIKQSLHPKELKKVELIYNGIRDAKIPAIRNTPKNLHTFALTSRLVGTKGIGEVIGASRMLDEADVRHRVLFLGEGPEESLFRDQAGSSVQFLGYPKNALSILAGADTFVHPTYNEAFSLSLVEAAMLGMPVITTSVGGNPEIIEDHKTGILVEPKNSTELYNAMLFAINHTAEMKAYGAALRTSYVAHFQFDKLVRDKLVPLYNSSK